MTNSLIVDDKEFVTAATAGKHFGYTKDYLLLLIKEEKIEGRKIGNKWYVYMPTAEFYFRRAKKDREAQRKMMSLKRKQEFKAHTRTREKSHRRTAVIETLVIVVLGLSLGATGYIGTTSNLTAAYGSGNSYSVFEKLALSLYTLISPGDRVRVSESVNQVVVAQVAPASSLVGTNEQIQRDALIVAPAHLFSTTSVASIQDSFSDKVSVSVDPENERTGIITPIFKNSESESYRFLMVPVQTTQ